MFLIYKTSLLLNIEESNESEVLTNDATLLATVGTLPLSIPPLSGFSAAAATGQGASATGIGRIGT
jgi:hypothetical protein